MRFVTRVFATGIFAGVTGVTGFGGRHACIHMPLSAYLVLGVRVRLFITPNPDDRISL